MEDDSRDGEWRCGCAEHKPQSHVMYITDRPRSGRMKKGGHGQLVNEIKQIRLSGLEICRSIVRLQNLIVVPGFPRISIVHPCICLYKHSSSPRILGKLPSFPIFHLRKSLISSIAAALPPFSLLSFWLLYIKKGRAWRDEP